MKAREVKRAKMAAKYTNKRAALRRLFARVIPRLLMRLLRNSRICLTTQILSVSTTVANLLDVQKATSACSAFQESSSVRWPHRVLSRTYARQAGNLLS